MFELRHATRVCSTKIGEADYCNAQSASSFPKGSSPGDDDLVGAGAVKDGADCSEDDEQVAGQRPVLYVVQVQSNGVLP